MDKIIDSHHHLWDITKLEYPWMPPGESVLKKNYLPVDLYPVMKEVGVVRTIVVQAAHDIRETEFLLYQAQTTQWIAGVVGWVDLNDSRVGESLDKLLSLGPLVGIRHQAEDDPDDDWLVKRETIRGLREVESRGLKYDVLIKARHLRHVPFLAEELPSLPMVIDHIAKPFISEQTMEPWANDISAAAAYKNIYCKVSGMVTEADHKNWKVSDLVPFVTHIKSIFSADKLMWGSDWPVCLLASSYEEVLESTLQAMGSLTEAEKEKFLYSTALKFYGIED